jgi:hypothetical protein
LNAQLQKIETENDWEGAELKPSFCKILAWDLPAGTEMGEISKYPS